MNIRTPQPSAAAKILRSFFATQGISVRHTLALEAVARMKGYPSTHAMRAETPDDAELANFLEETQGVPGSSGNVEHTGKRAKASLRLALAQISSFVLDDFPRIEYAKAVSKLATEVSAESEVCNFAGFTLTLHLESDEKTARKAPYACFSKRIGTPGEGWTDLPIPAESEFVTDLSLKVLLRSIGQTGITFTGVYDESPSKETLAIAD